MGGTGRQTLLAHSFISLWYIFFLFVLSAPRAALLPFVMELRAFGDARTFSGAFSLPCPALIFARGFHWWVCAMNGRPNVPKGDVVVVGDIFGGLAIL